MAAQGTRTLLSHEIVVAQGEATTRLLLDDLEALPADRGQVVKYDALLASPSLEISRLGQALGFEWDRPLAVDLPLSRFAVSTPAVDKWRRHAALIEPLLPSLQATIDRAERFACR